MHACGVPFVVSSGFREILWSVGKCTFGVELDLTRRLQGGKRVWTVKSSVTQPRSLQLFHEFEVLAQSERN